MINIEEMNKTQMRLMKKLTIDGFCEVRIAKIDDADGYMNQYELDQLLKLQEQRYCMIVSDNHWSFQNPLSGEVLSGITYRAQCIE